ncbi:MAG: hypothetical protein ABI217_12190 [Chthoniobacterales bacterium]
MTKVRMPISQFKSSCTQVLREVAAARLANAALITKDRALRSSSHLRTIWD